MKYLVTGKQAVMIDRYTIEEMGVPQLVLMERAALAVAEEVSDCIQDKKHDRILVVAESGNNGGDGVAAARILCQRGYRAEVWALGGIRRPSDAYIKQTELAKRAGVPFITPPEAGEDNAEDAVSGYRVIVDAIFGVGLTREVGGVQKDAVDRINRARASAESGMTVIAVDIPSGITSENGEILGTAVKADRTVTFGFEKVGMRLAKEACGTVLVREIGFYLPEWFGTGAFGDVQSTEDGTEKETCFISYEKEDVPALLPKRSADGNKGSYGRVLVAAGSEDIYGAAYLAAEAAYRTGCGLVKVVTHENNRAMLQQALPEALMLTYGSACSREEKGQDRTAGPEEIISVFEEEFRKSVRWASVIILGPGLGQTDTSRFLLETVLKEAVCPVIADADAINLLSEQTGLLEETAGQRPLILTPHMLEMTRLTEQTQHPERQALEKLKKERIGITEETAKRYRACLVLKDACTVVTGGGPDGAGESMVYLNGSGCDAMAKGGSGDVLTGMIAGLIAQGLPAPKAARTGVYLHGLTGETAAKKKGRYGVIGRDLIESISDVMSIDQIG